MPNYRLESITSTNHEARSVFLQIGASEASPVRCRGRSRPPCEFLRLATVMFDWWPLGRLSCPWWIAYAILFAVSAILNITSH